MKNLEIRFLMLDGSIKTVDLHTGRGFFSKLIKSDKPEDIASIYIRGKTKEGDKFVTIYVENSDKNEAVVLVKEDI